MSDKLDSIETKIDKLFDKTASIDITLVKQAASLDEHIRRTAMAEENIDMLRSDLKPIQKHVDQVHTIFKFIGLIATVVSIAAGIIKILGFFLS